MVKYLPAVGCLVLAGVFLLGATRSSTLACDRQTCTYGDRSFAVAAVREVRFVDGFGKNKDRAESVLVFANGTELRVARAGTERARVLFGQLRDFFAGTTPSLTITSKGAWWMFLAAAAAVAGAIGAGVSARRKRTIVVAAPRPPIAPATKKRIVIGGAALVAVAGLGQLALWLHAEKTQGTLELRCEQRCKFGGGECLPGGALRTTLDPGTYTIEIWAAAGSALWIPKTFEIRVGETTEFVCR